MEQSWNVELLLPFLLIFFLFLSLAWSQILCQKNKEFFSLFSPSHGENRICAWHLKYFLKLMEIFVFNGHIRNFHHFHMIKIILFHCKLTISRVFLETTWNIREYVSFEFNMQFYMANKYVTLFYIRLYMI